MASYQITFMGNVGFDKLKSYTKQATEFGRELVNIFNERAQVEQNYAKAIQRLGQRLSKSTSLVLGSPLSNAWKTVGVEMEKEAELHRDLGCCLVEDCAKPLSAVTEGQLKRRRMMEQQVEAASKTWNEKYAEHVKTKKRFHLVTRENESLLDQINGPRPMTEKDQQKLIAKQLKQVDIVQQTDLQYHNSLLQLERSRQEWESASFDCCAAAEDMDNNRLATLCDVIRKYTNSVFDLPLKSNSTRYGMDELMDGLSPAKEISVVNEKQCGVPYLSEQLLCDYYQENFNSPMSIDRRRASINKLLAQYINDLQKERSHHDGLMRLDEKSGDADFSVKLNQSTAMLVFFDVIRYKLNAILATMDGNSQPSHPFSDKIERHTDKQGIMYSTLKLKPGDADEIMKNFGINRSFKTRSLKSPAPSAHHASRTLSLRSKSESQETASSRNWSASTPGSRKGSSSSFSSSDYQRQQSDFGKEPVTRTKAPPPPPPSLETNGTANALCRCVAVYSYDATREDELSIREGELISVLEKGVDGWWRGEVNGKTGLFPSNYVENDTPG